MLFWGIFTGIVTATITIISLVIYQNLLFNFTLLAIFQAIRRFFIIDYLKSFKSPAEFRSQGIQMAIYTAFISGIADYLDGVWVYHFCTPEQFLWYRYGARELPISLIICNSFAHSQSLHFNNTSLKQQTQALAELRSGNNILLPICFIPAIVLMVCVNYLFEQVYGTAYIAGASIFAGYLLLTPARVFFPQAILNGTGEFKLQFKITLIEIIIHVLISVITITTIGVWGAVIATLIAYYTEKLLSACWLFYAKEISPLTYWPAINWSIWTVLLFISFIIHYLI
jgi:hypothetical protein